MRTAYNPQTGEVLGLKDGQWVKLQTASNASGDIVYLGDSGWEPLDIGKASTPNEPQRGEEPGFLEHAGRAFGLGTRNVLEGLGKGASLGLADPGRVVSDVLGLPQAETDGERLRGAIIEGAAGTMPMVGAGGVLSRAASPVVRGVGNTMRTAPVLQTAGDASAGGAAEMARQGGGGEGAQLAAALAGGMAPSVATVGGKALKGVLRATGGTWNMLTDAGRERIAADTLRRASSDPKTVVERVGNAAAERPLVEGSFPTTAEATGDRGLARLEKAMANAKGEQRFGKRRDDQFQARQEALQPIYDNALAREAAERERIMLESEALQRPGAAGRTDEDYGRELAARYGEKYGKQRQLTRDAYSAIDSEGKTAFYLPELRNKLAEALDLGRYDELPSGVAGVMNRIEDDIVNGRPATYRDLQGLRSKFSDMEHGAATQGDKTTARYAGRLKQAVDDYLTNAAMSEDMQGMVKMPAVGSKTFNEATRAATEAVRNDPHFDNLKYMMQQGINSEAVAGAIGPEGVRELNNLAPGLLRKNGKINYDELAGELGYTPDYMPSSGQDLLEALQNRLSGGNGRYTKAVGQLRDQLLDEQAKPHRGFSETDRALFNMAKTERTIQGKNFEQGYNKPLSRRGEVYGEPGMRPEFVPGNYFRGGKHGGASMRDFKKWATDDDIATLRDYAIGDLRDTATNPDGTLDAKKWRKWMAQHADALSQFPKLKRELSLLAQAQSNVDRLGQVTRKTFKPAATLEGERIDLQKFNLDRDALLNAGYSPAHVDMLQRVQDDIRRSARRDRFQKERGSDTFANFSAAEALTTALSGQMSDSILQNQAARYVSNGTARFLSKFVGVDPNEVVKTILAEAMLDPGFANSLLKRATPERVDSMWKYIGHALMKDRGTLGDVGKAAALTASRASQKPAGGR